MKRLLLTWLICELAAGSTALFDLGSHVNELDAGFLSTPVGAGNGNTFAFSPKLRGQATLLS